MANSLIRCQKSAKNSFRGERTKTSLALAGGNFRMRSTRQPQVALRYEPGK